MQHRTYIIAIIKTINGDFSISHGDFGDFRGDFGDFWESCYPPKWGLNDQAYFYRQNNPGRNI